MVARIPLFLLTTLAAGMATPQDDKMGKYDPPPKGLKRVRVGVPRFKAEKVVLSAADAVPADAAEGLLTLADRTKRFDVLESVQFEQLLKEQGLEDVEDPEELAKPGRVKGVDYLLIGPVTNLSVLAIDKGPGKKWVGQSKVTAECGVGLRLVDTATGAVLAAEFGEWKRTDTAGKLSLYISGEIKDSTKNELDVDDDSRGLMLRRTLDDAVRRMLPKLDKRLLELQK